MTTYTIVNADGFVENHNVSVTFYDNGTVRIGRTLHSVDELELSEDGATITHLPSGSTLERD
jgi:hypothetical protein